MKYLINFNKMNENVFSNIGDKIKLRSMKIRLKNLKDHLEYMNDNYSGEDPPYADVIAPVSITSYKIAKVTADIRILENEISSLEDKIKNK
jgi:hypothetical protein